MSSPNPTTTLKLYSPVQNLDSNLVCQKDSQGQNGTYCPILGWNQSERSILERVNEYVVTLTGIDRGAWFTVIG
jgi:hypothetical protein